MSRTGLKSASLLSSTQYNVGVLNKIMRVLRALEKAGEPMHLNDVALDISINRATTHRLLIALLRHGLVQRTVRGRYMLADGLFLPAEAGPCT